MNNILKIVNNYYTQKILTHGANHLGVDWNSEESQNLRFQEIARIIEKPTCTLNDYGCGYGGFYDYLIKKKYKISSFHGYDISKEMIMNAKQLHRVAHNTRFHILKNTGRHEMILCDYTVASGIFNLKFEFKESIWLPYVLQTLDLMDNCSEHAFSFNMLTKYSDREFMKPHLYYADPMFFFDYCKRHYSKNVAVLHDYNLYEFTILVRKK